MTHTRIHTHTHTHTQIRTHAHTHTLSHTHVDRYAHPLADIRNDTHAHQHFTPLFLPANQEIPVFIRRNMLPVVDLTVLDPGSEPISELRRAEFYIRQVSPLELRPQYGGC